MSRVDAGSARVVCEDFDTDTMMREVTFEFDPPLGGVERTHTFRMATMDNDGLPMATQDRMLREDRERLARMLGYELDGDGVIA